MSKFLEKIGLSMKIDLFRKYLRTRRGRNYYIRRKMNDFSEKLIAINNFHSYINHQTSFTLERKCCIDANNEHLDQLLNDLTKFINEFRL